MANFCKNCGGQISPSDTVCPSCGEQLSSTSYGNQSQNAYGQYSYGSQSSFDQSGYQSYSQPGYSQPYTPPTESTSVAGWIGWMLLCSFLPIIGQIIIIVAARDESLKNYAKATLILSAIGVVLSVIFMALFGTAFASAMKGYVDLFVNI